MCKTTNQTAENLLKNLRAIDANGASSFKTRELAEVYADLYTLKKELEAYEDVIKPVLIEKGLKKEVLGDKGVKVYLNEEGKKSTVYAPETVFNIVKNKEAFFELVTVIKKAVDESDKLTDKQKADVLACGVTLNGNPYVTCAKLNKQELAELKK